MSFVYKHNIDRRYGKNTVKCKYSHGELRTKAT